MMKYFSLKTFVLKLRNFNNLPRFREESRSPSESWVILLFIIIAVFSYSVESKIDETEEIEDIVLQENIMRTIGDLSGENEVEINGETKVRITTRNSGTTGNKWAAEYIAKKFEEYGLEPYDEDYFQEWWQKSEDVKITEGIYKDKYKFATLLEKHGQYFNLDEIKQDGNQFQILLRNVIGKIPAKNKADKENKEVLKQPMKQVQGEGQNDTFEPQHDKFIVIGAHYDSTNLDKDEDGLSVSYKSAPGANDNASGVSALIELARLLRNLSLNYDIILVAFGAEEGPASNRGSNIFVDDLIKKGIKPIFYINIDEMGRFNRDSLAMTYSRGFKDYYKIMTEVSANFDLILRDFSPFGEGIVARTDCKSFHDKGFNWVFLHEDFDGLAPPTDTSHTGKDIIKGCNFSLIIKCVKMLYSFLRKIDI